MSDVFLGGTCNDSTWRENLIQLLDKNVNYFNPVVSDWNKEAQEREIYEKKNSKYNLYVITPLMTGVFSIAEVVDDSNKFPKKTMFCVLRRDIDKSGKRKYFDEGQIKSLEAVKSMVRANGAYVFDTLEEIANFLNKK